MGSTTTDRDVVAFLLGDTLPPERLGALLHAGRRRKGWKRKQAAAMVRISAKKLKAYENGTKPVPADVCERLAECYGSDLTAHVPMRSIPEFGTRAEAGFGPIHTSDTPDDVIAAYVTFVRRLRRAKPGEPLPLRAADLSALSVALDADPEVIEQRIMDELGCSREEARALHRQVLVRRVVLPVAGLAASVGIIAGVQAAHASPEPTRGHPPVVEYPASVARPTTAVTDPTVAPPTTAAPAAGTTDTAAAGETRDRGEPASGDEETLLRADPFAGEPQIGDDDFVDPPSDMPRPVIDNSDYTEVSIPEGEEPSYDTPTTVPPDEPGSSISDPGIDHENP